MELSGAMPTIRALPVIGPVGRSLTVPPVDVGRPLPPPPDGRPLADSAAHGAMPPAPSGGPYSCGILIDTFA